ncbi:ammonium transporter [Parasphingorhabdus marina DSM 22363]|uniref:Ammonium transporter n=1 Tax=Parasphingorhabdus marina DSM 22363 TaxID=1123272 RepID=A0A1N6H4I1_9SPHN|nr:ammonium transporter [Parasphingorhabdus marina]SIO14622.1 ammonium transporter [Parasphingorhabdus marina DSM 22363]
MKKILTISAGLAAAMAASPALAQEAAEVADPSANVAYIFNTLLFLIGGFLVMWMAAGFAMLEAGLVRSKNVSMQCLKNIGLYSMAGIMFWVTGYNLMYTDVTSWIGSFGPYAMQAVGEADVDTGYSVASDWFFQMVFCATTASIVSGTIAERVKFWPFMIFVIILTGFLYPITGSWEWGTGWLDQRGFSDFAGSTLVHSVGGWAALAGALIIGPRLGRYVDGKMNVMPGSSIPLATLGTFILWLGWFGFNGASQLAMGTIGDVSDVSKIFVNTNMAAAGGVITAIVLTQLLYKKIDVTMALNGALAGLVSITAEPLAPSVLQSVIIGGIGGAIVVFAVPMLDKLKIDDVVGAIPVHLLAGIWGTIIVPFSNSDATYGVQALGIVSIGAFTFICSAVVWLALKYTLGVRPAEEDERAGMDISEVGVEAYPEFAKG